MAVDPDQKYALKGSQVEDLINHIKTNSAQIEALATDFSYKGSVADKAHLPNNAEVGDVYTTTDTGVIYVWDGDEWVALNDASITTFYVNSAETGATRHIYKDTTFVTPATVQNISDASNGGIVVLRGYNINTPSQYNEIVLVNVWQSPDDNDYQFVFAGDGIAHTYSAEALSDDVFGYYSAKYMFGSKLQTTGTSTTDVMSQNAVTSMVFEDPSTAEKVRIGNTNSVGTYGVGIGHSSTSSGNFSVAIGSQARAQKASSIAIGQETLGNGDYSITMGKDAQCSGSATNSVSIGRSSIANGGNSVAIGFYATCTPQHSIAIGDHAISNSSAYTNSIVIGDYSTTTASEAIALGHSTTAAKEGSVALGVGAVTTRNGEINVSTSGISTSPQLYGFNHTIYRLISGIYDGQGLHDAATVAQGNTLSTSAPTTTTEGVLGQLYTDTTNMHTYQCTAIDTTDPDNPSYTWTQRW